MPGDDPAVVGSAPFLAGQLPLPEPLDLPAAWQAWWLQHQSHRAAVDRADVNVRSEIIASNHSVRAALQMFAQNQDWPVQANQAYHGNCAVVAEQLAEELQHGAEGLYLFGGECHLTLPASPGRGGRNQHLALQLAQHLPRNLPVTAMMLASDGVDGQSDAAGAVFAPTALTAAQVAAIPAALRSAPTALTAAQVAAIPAALRSASSYDYWRQHGGLVLTGATGSNVADLVLCWKSAAN